MSTAVKKTKVHFDRTRRLEKLLQQVASSPATEVNGVPMVIVHDTLVREIRAVLSNRFGART